MRWKVGNGNRIRVWKDAWLDGPGPGRVVSPRVAWDIDTTLDTFIDPIKREWKRNLIRDVFLPFEADKILSIPISPEDELCW